MDLARPARMLVAAALAIVALAALASGAGADPAAAIQAVPEEAARPHGVYVDLFGKGGLWGLGYDWRPIERFALGAVGSYYLVGGDKYLTLSPYLALYPIAGARHGWFVHLGPQLVRRTVSSPGPEWSGLTTTAFAAELGSGWEYRNRVLVRVYGMAAISERVVPGLGVSLGWTL